MARTYSGVVPFLISLTSYFILGPLFLVGPLLINEGVRLIVSLYLQIKHRGEVWLVPDGKDGMYVTRNPGRTSVALLLLRFKGKLNRESLENLYHESIRTDLDAKGNLAYRKLEYLLIQEAGYPCWKRDRNFKFKNHIRLLDDNKQYGKDDLKKICKELSHDMDPARPQWEFIILPRYKEPGEQGETGYFIFRSNHGYSDGLSIIMLLKRFLSSNFSYYLDPLTFKIPTWKRYLFYLKAILCGPYALLFLINNRFRKVYWPASLSSSDLEKCERNYTWSCHVSLETINKISRATTVKGKASIASIVQTAFISAVNEVIPKERLSDEWTIAEIAALLPYPTHQLENRFTFFLYSIDSFTKEDDDFAKLRELGRAAREGVTEPFFLIFYLALYVHGRMPCFLHRGLLLDGAFSTTMFSNMPVSKTKAYFLNDAKILEVIAFPPQVNETGITLLSSSYCDNIQVAAVAKSSWLRQEELESVVGRIPGIIQKWAVIADKMSLK